MAMRLRRLGSTHREIAAQLGVATSSAHAWTRGIQLTQKQRGQIHERWYRQYRSKYDAYKKGLGDEFFLRISKNLGPHQFKQVYSSGDLLRKIRKFHTEHGRIPLKREFNDLRIYRIYFGSWNNAIIAAGFSPNPVLFAKKFVADDGHHCDSFSEKIIDDWLFRHNISHARHWKYGRTRMTADFFVGDNTIVEFFGLAGVNRTYDRIISRKRAFISRNCLRLIELRPGDIFPIAKLDDVLARLPVSSGDIMSRNR